MQMQLNRFFKLTVQYKNLYYPFCPLILFLEKKKYEQIHKIRKLEKMERKRLAYRFIRDDDSP